MDLGVGVLWCVAPSDAPSFPWCEDWKKQTTIPLLLLLFHHLSSSRHLPWRMERERSGLLPFFLSLLYSILSLTMMIGSKTRLSLLVGKVSIYAVFLEPCEST